jgi:hypothetical protein
MILYAALFLGIVCVIMVFSVELCKGKDETGKLSMAQMPSQAPQRIPGQMVKYIKWVLILAAFLALLKFIFITGSPWNNKGIFDQWNGVHRCSNFLFPIIAILAGFLAIYPGFRGDLWTQRFLGGLILLVLPSWAIYFPTARMAPKTVQVFLLVFFMLPFSLMALLSFSWKKRAGSLIKKKYYKIIILLPWILIILSGILYFAPNTSARAASLLLLPLIGILSLFVIIPLIINSDFAPKRLLCAAYLGLMSIYFLGAICYYVMLYYSFVGE